MTTTKASDSTETAAQVAPKARSLSHRIGSARAWWTKRRARRRRVRSVQHGSQRLSFEDFQERELSVIAKRRKRFGIRHGAPLVGLALSGGGIRSATFSLGFLQALSARGLLRGVDYLSTVSGGSYIGSFFGALFVPGDKRGGGGVPRPAFDPGHPLQSPLGLEAVRRLRESGRYLTPAGTSDAFFGAAVVIRNWAAVQLVIGAGALLGFWLLHSVDLILVGPPLERKLPLSPALLVLGAAALALCVAAACAYWLTRREWIPGRRWARSVTNLVFWGVLLVAGYAAAPWYGPSSWSYWLPARSWPAGLAVGMLLLILGCYTFAELRHGGIDYTVLDDGTKDARMQRARDRRNPQLLVAAEDRVRTALSGLMAKALVWLLIAVGMLMIDAIARLVPGTVRSFAESLSQGQVWSSIKAAWPVVVAVAPPLLSWIAHRRFKAQEAIERGRAEGTRPASWLPNALVLIGSLLVLLWLIAWCALSYYGIEVLGAATDRVLAVLAVLALLNVVLSLSFSFVNLSSLSIFYAARLRRAYIGASSYGTAGTSLRKDDPQDQIGLDAYYSSGPREGAPAHIINVTIAETVTGSSSLVARDRKGKPLQVTPAGICHEADQPGAMIGHHRRWGEELRLGNWVAISGAAVAAAIGSGTSLGTSILATMANVRLGYWWKQSRARRTRNLFWADRRDTVQNYLFSELRGAFHGTRQGRWYLTDGGHFENSGAYPLLQRKVPYIIICDNGADPEYAMGDIVRLIGRARTDLGIHVRFMSADEIKELLGKDSSIAGFIGAYDDLARRANMDVPGGPIAALAEIDYGKTGSGLLLLVKPRITYDEPPELLAYRAEPGCGDFPQQTTGDQFFDEVQWEAYRRLGELAGEKLFAARGRGQGWRPADMLERNLGVVPADADGAKPIQHSMKVHAGEPCNDTGFDLAAGAKVSIVASGSWLDADIEAGPDGYERWYLAPFRRWRRCPEASWLELVAQVGTSGKPCRVGAKGSFVAARGGRLFLYANDWRSRYGNNSGEIIAEITIS